MALAPTPAVSRTRDLILPLALLTFAGCASSSEPPTTAPSTAAAPAPSSTDPTPEQPAESPTADSSVAADVDAVLTDFVTQLDTELELQPEQQQAMRTVLSEHATAMQPHLEAIVSADSRAAKMRTAQAHRPPMDAIRQQTDDRVRALLDDDQYARYRVLHEEFRRELKAVMKRRHG